MRFEPRRDAAGDRPARRRRAGRHRRGPARARVEGARAGRACSRSPSRPGWAGTASAWSRSACCSPRSAGGPCRYRRWPRWRSASCRWPAGAAGDQQRDLLPGVTTGEHRAHRRPTGAVRPDARCAAHHGDPRRVRPVITGTKIGVPYAEQAHRDPRAGQPGRRRHRGRDRGPGRVGRLGRAHTERPADAPEYTLRLDGVSADGMLADAAPEDLYRYARRRGVRGRRRGAGRRARADRRPHRLPGAVRPAARHLPGRRAADRGRLRRVPHPAPGHAVGVLAAVAGPTIPEQTSTSPRTGWRRRLRPRCGPAITCTAGSASTSATRCTGSRR